MTETLTRGVLCRACQAPIYFLRTRKGHSIPCDLASVQPGDVDYDASKHKAHFATCPNAAEFRRKR